MALGKIAIVGRSCLFPGALTPAAFAQVVLEGRDVIGTCPPDRWRLRKDRVLADAAEGRGETAWTDRGGYVSGFDTVFDPRGFKVEADALAGLDPLFLWLLHTGREALRDAGCFEEGTAPSRTGAVVGLLSLPTDGLSRWAEAQWTENQSPSTAGPALNRFMSGAPALLLARALGLDGGAFSLDAACASSLYALKLACDRLHDGAADVMLAGAVSRADDLFIHVGFSTLKAISPSGRSRPFHRDADGLLPAEGAAFAVLKRLADATRDGDRILGVIHGIGLSNDGRSEGPLVPAAVHQERAIRAAYEAADMDPARVSLIECHATGTPIGDPVELESLGRVFAGRTGIPLGSAKSNMGHAITAAGMASLLKVLAAMEAGVRPPSLHADDPTPALAGTPFRLLGASEPWDGPRLAAVSTFGFGGNNAHLIVGEWTETEVAPQPPAVAGTDVAIVGMAALAGDGESHRDFLHRLFARAGEPVTAMKEFGLDIRDLRTPPRDLEMTLPQQLLLIKAAREALAPLDDLPGERTVIHVGMGCDTEIGRYGLRWRLPEWLEGDAGAACEKASTGLEAPGVIGTLANMVANRLNAVLDVTGPGIAVSAEELSGLVALDLSRRALASKEADVAIAAAVDVCSEEAHAAAARAVLPGDRHTPGDGAVVLVLKRLADAQRDGDPIHAIIPEGDADDKDTRFFHWVSERFGHVHAASGLLAVAAAAAACGHRALPGPNGARPWLDRHPTPEAAVGVSAMVGAGGGVVVRQSSAVPPPGLIVGRPPRLHVYAGDGPEDVLRALEADRRGGCGPARLVIVAADESERRHRAAQARAVVERGETRFSANGVFWHEAPVGGELAFVYPGAAAAYHGAGAALFTACPEARALIDGPLRETADSVSWVFADAPPDDPTPLDRLWGCSLLCQFHTALSRDVLGIRPDAAMGVSSGETNALFAMGAWQDIGAFHRSFNESGAFTEDLGGRFRVLDSVGRPADWQCWRMVVPDSEIVSALAAEPEVRRTVVNAPGDAVIAGPSDACARVIERVGRGRVRPLDFDVVVHCPELEPYAGDWTRLHHRPTSPVPGVRFYGHAHGGPYEVNDESVARALTDQAMRTVDFPAVVKQAWADGVRVFVEHGPQGSCTDAIRAILGERPHMAVSLDRKGADPLRQVADTCAQLLAASVEGDFQALFERWQHIHGSAPAATPTTRQFPAHRQPFRLPASEAAMAPPPWLPPVEIAWTAATAPAEGPVLAAYRQFVGGLATAHKAFIENLAEETQQGFMRLSAEAFGRTIGGRPTPEATTAEAPLFERADLERLASGRISDLLGDLFRQQDDYPRQVRMPEPPLLLADRVISIDAEAGSMGNGTIVTETDVTWDSWYLHEGRMPQGLMIEAGQADLLLISYLGADFHNRGERVYRLLGCDLTFHGEAARPGETLRYDIHIDGQARQGDIRMFFFHYDCRVGGEARLSVRNGQAGFFSDGELAESDGVLWDAGSTEPSADARVDAPSVKIRAESFDRDRVRAFTEGRIADCFGADFRITECHQRTPNLPAAHMPLFERVTHLQPGGGPWRRGYLRAELDIRPDQWFFDGHFKGDPCMPGTLMFEGCMQAMAFYMAAMGASLDRDGWLFEAVPEETYRLRCRGQVTPGSSRLVYEVFVDSFEMDPVPTLYADILCTVDGLKAFHCRRMGVRLAPAWPMDARPQFLPSGPPPEPVARINGMPSDFRSLLACAWGRPTDAFGPPVARFDSPERLARLPGPPYHFMSRITLIDGTFGGCETGTAIECAYDVPPDAWYFAENDFPIMPFGVLMEAGLQPCGWLSVFTGIPLDSAESLLYRNLDGWGEIHREVGPDEGTLRFRVEMTRVVRSAGISLMFFVLSCRGEGGAVFDMETSFGFFRHKDLAVQVGLPPSATERERIEAPANAAIDLPGTPSIGTGRILMIDRITGLWPDGGEAGLGRIRGELDVHPGDWFFKAHFFQDPVQPGSLGVQALVQTLQVLMRERGDAEGIDRPRFEAIATGKRIEWKYRAQVVPTNKQVVTEVEILSVERDEGGLVARAWGALWADGLRIYLLPEFAMRIVPGGDHGTP